MLKIVGAAFGALCMVALAGTALAQTSSQASQPDNSQVVARVNGAAITRGDMLLAQQSWPQQYRNLPLDQVWKPLLKQVINSRLIAQAAQKDGLEKTDAYKQQMAELSDEVLQQLYVKGIVEKKITDQALHDAYKKWAAKYVASGAAEEVHARHILVKTEAEAKTVIKRLNNGEDFAKIAKEVSIGPSAANGGDLGWFHRTDMVPKFADAAFALKDGQISAPVHTQYGWHVIQVEGHRTGKVPSFEATKQRLTNQLARTIISTELAQLHDGADIKILVSPPSSSNSNSSSGSN